MVSALDDALGLKQLNDILECVKQIAMADTVILTKTETEALRACVQAMNPSVKNLLANEVI